MKNKKHPQDVALARRLQAAGVPLEIIEREKNGGLLMNQIGSGSESCAFDLRTAASGYMVYMRIVIDLPAFAIFRFDLDVPWEDPSISLLEDPIETGDPHNEYSFPGENLYRVHRSLVINRYADVRCMRRRGQTLEGFLLWWGLQPIPDDWPVGKIIPAFVTVIDQWNRRYEHPVTLLDARSGRPLCGERKKKNRKPLFECPDRVPVGTGVWSRG